MCIRDRSPAGKEMKICSFLWTYYGYPNSNYEGRNVEVMRYENGAILARNDKARGLAQDIDYVAGVPDSGVPHAIGYANESHTPFARPFIKYTPTWPRSFMPENQKIRNQVAKMKQIPVPELIEGKKLLFVDDSIVRGTQLRETVEFLYESGAAEEMCIRDSRPAEPFLHHKGSVPKRQGLVEFLRKKYFLFAALLDKINKNQAGGNFALLDVSALRKRGKCV